MSDDSQKEDAPATRPGNEVFGGSPNMQPPEEIPYDNVPLPSNGTIYPIDSPLHGKTHVPIKILTTQEENILTSPALIKTGKVIQVLLEACMMDKDIKINDLIAGDRNAIMVSVRISGYGSEYEVPIECSKCDTEYDHEFNLNALVIKRLEISPIDKGMNLFEYILPRSKKRVLFKFITGHDEEQIDEAAERRKKIGLLGDSKVTDKLRHSIVELDGSKKRGDIEMDIQKMFAYDSSALRGYMDKHEPGIDMTQETTCPGCGNREEVTVPIGIGFFYPTLVE